ncbi:FHA domain-containing protein [Pseudarthrobacter sp. J75]|uniref:FHA domain-containing protein n=1 Tax=unclassified Pseudarthrobacter TaxID=2647000 RepID=UPI002E8055FA|nr:MULTISPECIES: FHA domain-containing protein [unclassified Pseudarthrobacter]MEE2521705.1 FHA domain-containing protein [Pseudarthrobacter sp. J47]MEE2527782.1 FHA domain-containing protein [Pseudarthrobacter sp. J75]MEE2569350.1 FHA domain-containing protein [Pseudarthrobacter sp. J64]
MTASYHPGPWLGVVRGQTAVLLEAGTSRELVLAIWDLLAEAPEVHEVLHAVTAGFGGSLTGMPSFGIVGYKDSLRVFLRGDLDLEIDGPDGLVELNGRNVSTWAERWLAEPGDFRISVAGQSRDSALPLAEGVVQLSGLAVEVGATPPEAATAAVAAAAAPVVSEPVVSEPVVQDPVVLEPVDAEPVVPEPVDAEPVVPEPVEFEPVEFESVVPEPVVPDPDVPELAEPELETPVMEVSAETMMGLSDEDLDYTVAPADLPSGPAPEEVPPAAPASGPAAPEPAYEMTSNYDHLWEKTVARSIEDAAVRDEPEEEHGAGPELPGTPEPPGTDEPVAPMEPAEAGASSPGSSPQGAPAPPSLPDLQAGAGSGLIDSVPWRTQGPPASAPAWTPPAATVPEPVEPAPAQYPASFDDDHDGQTIMKSDLAGMVAHPAPVVAEPASGPLVLARVCGQGHANPPTHAQCAACGQPLPADAVQVPRPRLGVMRISTGEVVELDQSLVIGRQPSVSRVQGGGMPRMVQVASPSGDISRSHVEVRLEGWHVMLCDLKATNGTVLVRQGQPPRRLAQNEMAILLDGDIAELGDDVSLRFEEIL